MAENFSDEGLDRMMGFTPGGTGTLDTTLYMAAITTAGSGPLTGTTVPARTTVWSSGYSTAGGEPVIGTGAYARVSMANSVWAAAVTNGSGRQRTASQQSFPASTAAWSNPSVIGFAIVTAATATAGVAYYYSNFSDNSTVSVNATGITLQVTPYWQQDI